MPLRDLTNNLDFVESIRPQSGTAEIDGESVDLRGSDSAMVVVSVGAITGTGGDAAVILEESDDDTTFTAVAADDIIGTQPTLTADTDYQFGYRGTSRYVRANFDPGAETSVLIAAAIVRGHLHRAPTEAG